MMYYIINYNIFKYHKILPLTKKNPNVWRWHIAYVFEIPNNGILSNLLRTITIGMECLMPILKIS